MRFHLEKAWHLAQAGRPGPCWLDIPVDVQNSQVDPENLRGYDSSEFQPAYLETDLKPVSSDVLARLTSAKRPVIMVGKGVRSGGALKETKE